MRPILVLVTGDDRGNVIFYKRTSDSFAEILSLPVHSDWIRDMTVQILGLTFILTLLYLLYILTLLYLLYILILLYLLYILTNYYLRT